MGRAPVTAHFPAVKLRKPSLAPLPIQTSSYFLWTSSVVLSLVGYISTIPFRGLADVI